MALRIDRARHDDGLIGREPLMTDCLQLRCGAERLVVLRMRAAGRATGSERRRARW